MCWVRNTYVFQAFPASSSALEKGIDTIEHIVSKNNSSLKPYKMNIVVILAQNVTYNDRPTQLYV